MSTMRAKVKLNALQPNHGTETLIFNPVAKSGAYNEHGQDEDNNYVKYSPSGQFVLTVANPALLGTFKVGETYYVDFTKVD